MKNLFKVLAVGVIALCAAAFPQQSMAQSGEKTLGVAGGFATYNSGGLAKLYFQYSFSNHVRIAPEVGYVFRNEGKSAFVMSVDMQFPFKLAKGFAIYPLAGVTFNNWTWHDDKHASRVGADFGAGFDIYLTSNLKLSMQGKYSMMNDTDGGFIDFGIGYVF